MTGRFEHMLQLGWLVVVRWQTHLPADAAARLEELHLKRQREGLTEQQENEAAALIRQYERVMLIRAQAAALLKQRGHDVTGLPAAT
jgi:hypothetical protein